jgi:CelD/BcsL family acetyltransferase involved in cellulose biosynthesis
LLALDVVTDMQRFEVLHKDWNALACRSGTVFQTWEWSWQWWNSNKKGKRLFIVTAYEDGKLKGLAPLYVASSYVGLPAKVMSIIGTNGTDYLSFLLDRGSTSVAGELLDFIQANGNWDALDFHQLADNDPSLGAILNKASESGLAVDKIEQDVCYRLHLPNSYDGLLAGLSKKFRWNVRYYGRRLAKDHNIVFRLSDKDTVERDMDIFFTLHKKRFMSMKKPGSYLSPSFRRMHTSIASELCESGWLRLYVMEIDNLPVAAIYGFSFTGSFYYYLGGFDPKWGKMSVSTVLIAYVIEQAIAEGLKIFDFLRGEEPYKEKWMATKSFNYRVLIHRTGAKSHFVKKMLSIENELTKRAKDIVHNMR